MAEKVLGRVCLFVCNQFLDRPTQSSATFGFTAILLSSPFSFFRYLRARWTELIFGHMFRSESDLKIHVRNLGYLLPPKIGGPKPSIFDVFRWLRMKLAFCTYRPLLEFSSQVWSPRHRYHIDKIESIQRFFTKKLSGLQNLAYLQHLKVFDLHRVPEKRIPFYFSNNSVKN